MHKLSDLYKNYNSTSFIELLKSKWDHLHNNTDVFRYKVDKLEEKLVDDKYYLLLNPNRRGKRRPPDEMNSISQPFDKNKFHFTKVSPNEVLLTIEDEDSDQHKILVNDSPISRYHSLLCPSVNKCQPQVATADSLALAINIMFLAQDRDLRILFNSLCGFASVNHLHYHLFFDKNDFYVENVKFQCLKENIYKLDDTYLIPAFCFEVQEQSIVNTSNDIYKIVEYFLNKSIAHNILLTRRKPSKSVDNVVRVIIWPRKSTSGAKLLSTMNVAVLELSGWFPIYDKEIFKTLTADIIEKELISWRIEHFDQLCEDIKSL